MPKADKKNLINWTKKNDQDNERIKKHLDERVQIIDSSPMQKDFQPKTQPTSQRTTPLLRVRKSINEAYDEEDEENESYVPFFNISLISENEREYNHNDELKQKEKNELETIRITKQQQMAGKLNIIMDTIITAEKAGLPKKFTHKDGELLNSAEYNLPKTRRKAVKEKIEKPLKIEGAIPEKKLKNTVKSIKHIQQDLPLESFKGLTAEEIIELDEADKKETMAKLILKKSGRKNKTKNLAQLAKELNEIEQQQPEIANKRPTDQEKN